MTTFKGTTGEWIQDGAEPRRVYSIKDGHNVADCLMYARSEKEAEANAKLIAEAGTVMHETGKSPMELVEINKELLDSLQTLERMLSNSLRLLKPYVAEQFFGPLDTARLRIKKATE